MHSQDEDTETGLSFRVVLTANKLTIMDTMDLERSEDPGLLIVEEDNMN